MQNDNTFLIKDMNCFRTRTSAMATQFSSNGLSNHLERMNRGLVCCRKIWSFDHYDQRGQYDLHFGHSTLWQLSSVQIMCLDSYEVAANRSAHEQSLWSSYMWTAKVAEEHDTTNPCTISKSTHIWTHVCAQAFFILQINHVSASTWLHAWVSLTINRNGQRLNSYVMGNKNQKTSFSPSSITQWRKVSILKVLVFLAELNINSSTKSLGGEVANQPRWLYPFNMSMLSLEIYPHHVWRTPSSYHVSCDQTEKDSAYYCQCQSTLLLTYQKPRLWQACPWEVTSMPVLQVHPVQQFPRDERAYSFQHSARWIRRCWLCAQWESTDWHAVDASH